MRRRNPRDIPQNDRLDATVSRDGVLTVKIVTEEPRRQDDGSIKNEWTTKTLIYPVEEKLPADISDYLPNNVYLERRHLQVTWAQQHPETIEAQHILRSFRARQEREQKTRRVIDDNTNSREHQINEHDEIRPNETITE